VAGATRTLFDMTRRGATTGVVPGPSANARAPYPISTVVVPLDGSEFAARALPPARALAGLLGARIVLVATHWEDGMGAAREYLAVQARGLGDAPVSSIVVHDRDARDAILLQAEDPGAIVCMSTHGRGGVGQAVLGSLAEQVVRSAHRPVVLIGPAVDLSMPIERGGELVVGVDGSEAAEASIATAHRLARLLDLEPWIVQVLPGGKPIVPAPRAAESAYVRWLADRFPDDGRPARWKVLHGLDPAHTFAGDARRSSATLVAVATHGRSGVGRIVLGSVAVRVVRESHCPVVVTRSRLH
jgi:nucleotide-binding universal stress UspA family protein